MIQHLQELLLRPAVSGGESAAADYIRSVLDRTTDSYTTDALGNILAFRSGRGAQKKKVLFAVSIDTDGYLVTHIGSDGTASLAPVGAPSASSAAYACAVTQGGVSGILIPDKEGEDASFCLETGAVTEAEATAALAVGALVAPRRTLLSLGADKHAAWGISAAASAAVLLSAMEGITDSYHDLIFAFTVQSQVGARGIRTAFRAAVPDLAVFLSPCEKPLAPASFLVGGALGYRLRDKRTLYSPTLSAEIEARAKANNIPIVPVLTEEAMGDATVADSLGIPCAIASIAFPAAHLHTTAETVSQANLRQALELLLTLAHQPLSV